jgi:hypothetical protein
MLDITPVTATITAMIRTGTTEQALLAAVALLFPKSIAGRAVGGVAGGDGRGGAAGGRGGKEALRMRSWMKWTLLASAMLGPTAWFLLALVAHNGRPKSSAGRFECAVPSSDDCFDVIDGFVRERRPGDVAPSRH